MMNIPARTWIFVLVTVPVLIGATTSQYSCGWGRGNHISGARVGTKVGGIIFGDKRGYRDARNWKNSKER